MSLTNITGFTQLWGCRNKHMKKYGMNKFLYKSGGPLKQYYLITIDVIHIQNIFG